MILAKYVLYVYSTITLLAVRVDGPTISVVYWRNFLITCKTYIRDKRVAYTLIVCAKRMFCFSLKLIFDQSSEYIVKDESYVVWRDEGGGTSSGFGSRNAFLLS